MKKTIAMAVLFTAAYSVTHSQIKKDAVLLGGQISFSGSKSSNNSTPPNTATNNVFLNLSAGKAIKENTIIGIYGGYGRGKSKLFIPTAPVTYPPPATPLQVHFTGNIKPSAKVSTFSAK